MSNAKKKEGGEDGGNVTSMDLAREAVAEGVEKARSAISRLISPASAKAAISIAVRVARKSDTKRSADTRRSAQGAPSTSRRCRYEVCESPSAPPMEAAMFTPIRSGSRSAT